MMIRPSNLSHGMPALQWLNIEYLRQLHIEHNCTHLTNYSIWQEFIKYGNSCGSVTFPQSNLRHTQVLTVNDYDGRL